MRPEDLTAKLQQARDAAQAEEVVAEEARKARVRDSEAELERRSGDLEALAPAVASALLARNEAGSELFGFVVDPPPIVRTRNGFLRRRRSQPEPSRSVEAAGWRLMTFYEPRQACKEDLTGSWTVNTLDKGIPKDLVLLADGRLARADVHDGRRADAGCAEVTIMSAKGVLSRLPDIGDLLERLLGSNGQLASECHPS